MAEGRVANETTPNAHRPETPVGNSRWRKVLALAGWVILVGVAVVFVGWRLTAPVKVRVMQPERGELIQEVFGTGTFEAKSSLSMNYQSGIAVAHKIPKQRAHGAAQYLQTPTP
jgi:hypothetical protein